jgi:type II secretory pathway component PulM
MTHPCSDQRDLFDDERQRVELQLPQLVALTATMEALFREIAEALAKSAKAENGREQDHR